MAFKLKIFISSTQEDLGNERRAVADVIERCGYEAIYAESLSPDGSCSWDVIEDELADSHLVVLILGDRYGWVPDSGPGAGSGQSVTRMEFEKTKELDIPVLPFFKRLRRDPDEFDPKKRSQAQIKDARARDEFRKEVLDWAKGYFRGAEFNLYDDLANEVQKSLHNLLAKSYLKSRVKQRSKTVSQLAPPSRAPMPLSIAIPDALLNCVVRRDVVLFAGSGMSIDAGPPSGYALSSFLASQIQPVDDSYTYQRFMEVADNYETRFGRRKLVEVFVEALDPPNDFLPTSAHEISVELIDRILTTNNDCLFERAFENQKVEYDGFMRGPEPLVAGTKPLILYLHGSIDDPESLVLTEREVWQKHPAQPEWWDSVLKLVNKSPLLVIGSSISDPTTKRLIYGRDNSKTGYYVGPQISEFNRLRCQSLNLVPIEADANGFFATLKERLTARG